MTSWAERVNASGNFKSFRDAYHFIYIFEARITLIHLFDCISSQTEEEIKNETDKRARWAKDNIRRRHNFLPLVMEIIKQMASQKSLVPAVTKVIFLEILTFITSFDILG